MDKSLNHMIKGSYAGDETTLLGTLGEILVGCVLGVGQVADIREVVYDIQNWELKWSNAGDLVLDAIGFIPLIGDVIKGVKKYHLKK